MKTLLNIGLSLLLLLSACGQQLVEYGDEEAGGNSGAGRGGNAGQAGNAGNAGNAGRGGNAGTTDAGTGDGGDVTAPAVISTNPLQGETGVALGTSITATFSEAMNAATINGSNFIVTAGTTAVSGFVTFPGGVATFTPVGELAVDTEYVATITTGVTDVAGNALASDYAWTFNTGGVTSVTSTTPPDLATAVANNVAITATFSGPMDGATLDQTTFVVTGPGVTPVLGAVAYDAVGRVASFTPATDLVAEVLYTATITTGAKNPAGTALAADYVWTFTTGDRPTVTSTTPVDGASDVANNTVVTARFGEAMNPLTLGDTTFTLTGPGTAAVAGSVTYTASGSFAEFTPSSDLAPGVTFTATITTGATDLAGNGLASDFSWTFTSGDAPTVTSNSPILGAVDVSNNVVITASFSEVMDTSTILPNTFTVRGPAPGNTPVGGSVDYNVSGSLASFTPLGPLLANTVFTVRITTGVTDLAGVAMLSDYEWTFTTGEAPSVLLESPVDGALDVSNNTLITASFSEPMDAASLTDTTVEVTGPGTTVVLGALDYDTDLDVLTFTPDDPLADNVVFSVIITTGATDLDGNALENDFEWSFTSGEPPSVLGTVPLDGELDVSGSTVASAAFSEAMDVSTIDTASFTLTTGVGLGLIEVDGSIDYDLIADEATFTPDDDLDADTEYTATITTAATDVDGNPLSSDVSWTFTTGSPPTVLSTNPADTDINVAINKVIQATFSEAMALSSVDGTTYTLRDAADQPVAGVVAYNLLTHVASFTPDNNLEPNSLYSARITTGATDLAGNPLLADVPWTFTTGTQAAQTAAQAGVALGEAGHFAILASGAITNIPFSAITGDVGLTPTAGSGITGFDQPLTCPEVVGVVYTVDNTGPACATVDPVILDLAVTDAGLAFIDARNAVRGTPAQITTDLAGLTLYPGLYQSDTTLEFASGTLTLDAQGDPNAVFILRSESSITTQDTSQVILTKGAQAANVYWTAASAITLGTTSIMKGTLIAGTAISMLTDAVLEGRALTQGPSAAAVTLDSNTITLPLP
jgi:ice-binding like protein/Big-like domain-containing protein